jgi:DNA-binding transcriptional regulator LsrR (DeoR family)
MADLEPRGLLHDHLDEAFGLEDAVVVLNHHPSSPEPT